MTHESFEDRFRDFVSEVRKIFQHAAAKALEAGQRRDLSATEIGTVIMVATIHCQSLTIIGANLPLADFDGLLEQDLHRTQARYEAHGLPPFANDCAASLYREAAAALDTRDRHIAELESHNDAMDSRNVVLRKRIAELEAQLTVHAADLLGLKSQEK